MPLPSHVDQRGQRPPLPALPLWRPSPSAQLAPTATRSEGRDLVAGIPKTISIDSEEIHEALSEPVSAIVDAVRGVLERAPPELCADIVDKGIVLTGGGSKLRNLDKLLSDETGLPVFLCDEPEFAVVLGSGAALDEINILKEVALD